MVNSKAKGGAFERGVCKALSAWWTKGKRDDVFWRAQSSGGRATQRNKAGKTLAGQYGDICATDPIGVPLMQAMTIEAKKGYNANIFHDMLDISCEYPHPQRMEVFIAQAMEAHRLAGSFGWAVIHERNRRVPCIYMPYAMARELDAIGEQNMPKLPPPVLRMEWELMGPKGVFAGDVDVIAMPLSTFFEYYKPEHFATLGSCAPCAKT